MNWYPDDEPLAGDEPLGRPFLSRASSGEPPRPADSAAGEVRPYLLTGGRTRPRRSLVTMETVVLASGLPPLTGGGAAAVERARILDLARRPCSAAEVSARLNLPLTVALVLVTDLVTDGLLDASMVAPSQAEDVSFLERLIAGVAAL